MKSRLDSAIALNRLNVESITVCSLQRKTCELNKIKRHDRLNLKRFFTYKVNLLGGRVDCQVK